MMDILYVSFNRLAYTRETFRALIDYTDWENVVGLFIADDASTDGTERYLGEANINAAIDAGVEIHVNPGPFGGPVAAMNWYLDNRSADADRFAKIDNDFVVCPGWDNEILRQMTLNAGVDIFGIEPMIGPPVMPPYDGRHIEPARFIGGKGIIRHRAFECCRPIPKGDNGYFGFTEWQSNHAFIEKAWVTPDLPVFGLDQLPFEPWISLAQEYLEAGWHRQWAPYDIGTNTYWDWWVALDPARRTA